MSTAGLDAQVLLAAAIDETGLSDFGDASLPDRFALVVERLRDAGMDAQGCAQAAAVCRHLLVSRLRFFGDHARFPGIADEAIERPMCVTGEPRSGTTLMHALLSVDPAARSLRFWEVMYPSPPPALADQADDRHALADADWRDINARMPAWLTCHPYNDMLGDGLPECERTWAFDFRMLTPTAWWRVPMGMTIAGLPIDPVAQYRIHRMMLQHCQYRRPKKRWVLKGFHGPRLAAFFETYPDVRLIWMHRDPVQLIASRIAMAMALSEGLTGAADLAQQAAIHLGAARQSLAATMANPLLDDSRILHVRYQDFVADPVAMVRRFYDFSEQPFSDDSERAMRNYLVANRADRYGRFVYSPDMIGEDVAKLNAEFSAYRERFGVDIEKRGH